MQYDSLKKHANCFVKIRPALQRYDTTAVLLDTLEDRWWLSEVNPSGAKLSNPTGHFKELGLDAIHHFNSDPEAARAGLVTGTLMLNVQLLMFKGELLAEPVAPPGTPLKSFVPAQTREDLFSVAKRQQAALEFSRQKQVFATSPAGVAVADKEFYAIFEAFAAIETALHEQGVTVEIIRKMAGVGTGAGMVIGAFGWWVSITWERHPNTLENSRLTITKWDSHPPFPGVLLLTFTQPNRLTVEQYTFGLVSKTEARWISWSTNERTASSMEIATAALEDFMNNPLV